MGLRDPDHGGAESRRRRGDPAKELGGAARRQRRYGAAGCGRERRAGPKPLFPAVSGRSGAAAVTAGHCGWRKCSWGPAPLVLFLWLERQ